MRDRNKTRWGILGTGRIAGTLAEALAVLPDAELVAVGSRSAESADRFGDRFDVPRRHATYEALLADDDVDVIYVATPHTHHPQNTIDCLNAGRAVLCEKPFAINAALSQSMIDVARARKLFLMEAMWSRFLPAHQRFYELIEDGAIGEPRTLVADFGFAAPFDAKQRLFNPQLGGGALLDVGVYPLTLATRIFGEPESIVSSAHLGDSGVDEQSAAVLQYAGGAQATIGCAIRTETGQEACLYGTEGFLRLESPWYWTDRLTIGSRGKEPRTLHIPYEGNGYTHEAIEVMRCLGEGLTESPKMTHENTLQVMRLMDRIRAPWGLRYPQEQAVSPVSAAPTDAVAAE